MRWTEKLYRKVTRKISSRLPANSTGSIGEKDERLRVSSQAEGVRRYWFHAASAGELESLWSLVIRAAEGGAEIWLSVFSSSGLRPLERLAQEVKKSGGRLLFAGFSPREGFWRDTVAAVKPNTFVTAKYEAWPELWMSLAEHEIPLVLVGARNRPSIRLADRLCRTLAGKLPPLALLTASAEDQRDLGLRFPQALIQETGDPRWDRVLNRATLGHPRAQELFEKAKWLPKPWGILGSAWLEDLEFMGKRMGEVPGTIWVVPHHVDERTVGLIERHLQQFSQPIIRSSQSWQGVTSGALKPKFVVVDEMGFLSELYSKGDWAFVGGGFGKGIHSTIEPAIHGIAIAAGKKGAHRFPEISNLQKTGQLTLLNSKSDLEKWIGTMKARNWTGRMTAWVENVETSRGATDRVWQVILQAADGSLLKSV